MKIPKDALSRAALYEQVMDKCLYSIENRSQYYALLRAYYNSGASSGDVMPIFNNIYPHIDTLSSMLYAQDTTKFSVELDATESAKELSKCPSAARRVLQEWRDSNSDIVVGRAVRMSLVDSTKLVKLIWHSGALHSYIVDPENFGVLREDIAFLNRQQACCEKYSISKSALETMLQNHPNADKILENVSSVAQKAEERTGIDKILVSQVNPNISGQAVMPWMNSDRPRADVVEPMVEMKELYIYDDELQDYRVVTYAAPGIVVFDRACKSLFLKNELPYVQICPNIQSDYFWGESEVGKLITLQDMLNERMWDIRKMLARQAQPTVVGSGMMGPEDEIALAFQTPGSLITADQGFNMKEVSPQIPDDLFRDVQNIMNMFEITSGISGILQGRGESGVRSAGHAAELARFASGRAKQRALIIEDAIEKIATLIFKLLQRYSDDKLIDSDGKDFLLEQMTSDCHVMVDAHSSSPVFIEDMKQMAFALQKVGAIDNEDLLDLTNPPNLDMLKAKFRMRSKEQAASKAKEQEQDRQFELRKEAMHVKH